MSKLEVRSSSLPQLMSCTPSILNPDKLPQVYEEIEAALVGTLVHAQCQMVAETGAFDLESMKQRLSEADYERANVMFNNFLAVWRQAEPSMPTPLAELDLRHEFDEFILTGHIDLSQINKQTALVLDYKTGRQHEDHYHQMAAYAYLLWAKQGKPEPYTVYVTTVYLEDKSITPYTFTHDNLKDWANELKAKLKDTRYTVGRKCAFCALQSSCNAYRLYVAGAVGAVTNADPMEIKHMTPEARGDLMDKVYVIEKAAARVKTGMRDLVKNRGEVDIGKGMVYTLVTTHARTIDSAKAQAVLKTELPQHAKLARYGLEDVLNAVSARAPRGTKTEAKNAFLAKLEEAGAIQIRTDTKMFRRPKGEQQMEET